MNLSIKTFMHPEDAAALEQLESIPMFPEAVKIFLNVYNERLIHGISMAQKIRLGPRQLPQIYQHLPPICETLGIDEPEFYLEMDPAPNAYTMGDTQCFVTITSGLVEYLDEDELQAVLAHECGHILFRHVLYHTMAMLLLQYGSAIFGALEAVSTPIRLALLYWYRRSELSADRAAAVVLKSPTPMVETMIRLAGGPKSITGSINLELYVQQAASYDKLLEDSWDKLLQNVAVMNSQHPFASVRTREITRWCDSPEYPKVLQAIEQRKTASVCRHCGSMVLAEWKFCRRCGRPNPSGEATTQQEANSHE